MFITFLLNLFYNFLGLSSQYNGTKGTSLSSFLRKKVDVSSNLQTNEIFKTTFTIASPPKEDKINFEVLLPQESFCVYEGKPVSINPTIVIQSAMNKLIPKEMNTYLEIQLTFDRFQTTPFPFNNVDEEDGTYISKDNSLKYSDFPNFDKSTTATLRVTYNPNKKKDDFDSEQSSKKSIITKTKKITFNKCSEVSDKIYG